MQENLKITNWKEHLPKMVNSYYEIEGVKTKFVKFNVFNDYVRLETTIRWHEKKFEAMPEFLASWMPVENEGIPSYDHRYAEMGLEAPKDSNLPLEDSTQTNEQITILNGLFVEFLQNTVERSKFLESKLDQSMILLKDPKSGAYGAAATEQAKQTTNGVKASIDLIKTNLAVFSEAFKIFGEKPLNKKGAD